MPNTDNKYSEENKYRLNKTSEGTETRKLPSGCRKCRRLKKSLFSSVKDISFAFSHTILFYFPGVMSL